MEVLAPGATASESAAANMQTEELCTKAGSLGAFKTSSVTLQHQVGENTMEMSAMEKCRASLGDPTYQLLRSAMLQQQEVFSDQLWDLHRLTSAQSRKVALYHHNMCILAQQNKSKVFDKQRQEHIRKETMAEILSLKSVASCLRVPRHAPDKATSEDPLLQKISATHGTGSLSPSSERAIQLGHEAGLRNERHQSHLSVVRNVPASTQPAKRDVSASPELPSPMQPGSHISQGNPAAVPKACSSMPGGSAGYTIPSTTPPATGHSQIPLNPLSGPGNLAPMQAYPLTPAPMQPNYLQGHCGDATLASGAQVPPALLNLHGVMNVPVPEVCDDGKEVTLASTHSCSLWSGNTLFLPSGLRVQDVLSQQNQVPGYGGLGGSGLPQTDFNAQTGEAGHMPSAYGAGKPQEQVQKNQLDAGTLKDDAAATILMSLRGVE